MISYVGEEQLMGERISVHANFLLFSAFRTGIVFPAATLIVVVLAGCVSSESVNNHAGTMVGKVYVTGNEPFTKFALQLEDGSAYILTCPKELQDQLSREQGKTVKVRFKGLEDALEGKAVKVISIEVLVR